MAKPKEERDEPLTPAGRLFLRPEMNQIIHCLIGVTNPINIDSIKSEISNSVMIKHPRFSSLMVRDGHGREQWRKTHIDIDRHIIIIDISLASTTGQRVVVACLISASTGTSTTPAPPSLSSSLRLPSRRRPRRSMAPRLPNQSRSHSPTLRRTPLPHLPAPSLQDSTHPLSLYLTLSPP
ncbi:hypothetical protein CsSME_00022557 [Camellia sinensis var. sinensis]